MTIMMTYLATCTAQLLWWWWWWQWWLHISLRAHPHHHCYMDIVISITIKQLLADDISRYMHTLIIIIIIIVIVVIVVIIVILVIITVITNGGEFASSSRKCFDCAEKPQPVIIWGLNTELISAALHVCVFQGFLYCCFVWTKCIFNAFSPVLRLRVLF